MTFDSLRDGGKPFLLVFVEPDCGGCEALMPDLADWQRKHADRLMIVPISRGELQANRAMSAKHRLLSILLQTDREVAEAYRAVGTPTAVRITNGKVSSHVAVGGEEIRTLVVRSTLPPPVKPGDLAPSLSFPDLNGKTVDLATLRGRRRLVLFWDPACSFCRVVTEDVKSWERKHADNARELLIISAGSAEVVRTQGFRSQVLLDPHFAAGTVLGANGAPSAVMLDEEGRVASDVGIGISGVFDFFGTVPYIPSFDNVVDAMLKLAHVGDSDTVFDLGCGDGRIVIAAAKKYGAHGVGVDIDPNRIREARAMAKKASVKSLVRFEQQDLLDVDIHTASVVALYLLPTLLKALGPKLLRELQPGTRVVSQEFGIEGWKPGKEEEVDGSRIYLWTIPERP